MAWSVTQKAGAASNLERVMDIDSLGIYFYSCIFAYNTRYYCITEKRRISDGGLEWQQGLIDPIATYPLSIATDGVRVYSGGVYGAGLPIGRIQARLVTTGALSWSYQNFSPFAIQEYMGVSVDGSYVYGSGKYLNNAEYCVQAITLAGVLQWEQMVLPGPGGGNAVAMDCEAFGGNIFSCGYVQPDAINYDRRVEARGTVAGALVWEVIEAGLADFWWYGDLAVDATGCYVLSVCDIGAFQLNLKLKSLAIVDGAEQWAVDVAAPLTVPGMGSISPYYNDIIILGNKLYIKYRYFDPMDPLIPGDIECIESRDKTTGAFIARDKFSTPLISLEGVMGVASHAPAPDEIIVHGNVPDVPAPGDSSCYWQNYLAATPTSGPTMDQIMRGCKWFGSGTFQGMYLDWR